MKAFFNRLNKHHNKDSPSRSKDSPGVASASENEKEKDKDNKSSPLLHDRLHEPLPLPPTPPPLPSFEKPLPQLLQQPTILSLVSPSEFSADVVSPTFPSSSKTTSKASSSEFRDSRARSSRSRQTVSTVPSNGDATAPKKVAFISPPPTPMMGPIRTLPIDNTRQPTTDSNSSKTHLPLNKVASSTVGSRVSEARDRQSSAGSNFTSTAVGEPSKTINTVKASRAITPRPVTSPAQSQRFFPPNPSLNPKGDAVPVRSGTPFSQNSVNKVTQPATSWSEGAEVDLVSNLGPRERTRQEVLYEIVASEDRYVTELLKLKETFIDPLLHPYSSPSPITPDFYDSAIEDFSQPNFRSPSPIEDSLDRLPIAARFLNSSTPRPDTPSASGHSSSKTGGPSGIPIIPSIADKDSLETDEDDDQMGKAFDGGKPGGIRGIFSPSVQNRSPYGQRSSTNSKSIPFPSRSHHSLPPPPRPIPQSTASLGRQSMIVPDLRKSSGTPASKVFKKLQKKSASEKEREKKEEDAPGTLAPHLLPADLKKCLEVIEGGILDGHLQLVDKLRKRYMEQYPLVRSLADVFVSHSHILHEYATYVLHLEKALEQVEDALSTVSSTKRPKNQDAAEWQKVCKVLQNLEAIAAFKAETGLAISLSKPFQRLLKYPLLFQNLLFHTDPSTFEYESTLQMVAEVETIVRSIEDEKIQKEERDRTRDVFARIEGLEKVKLLAVPKPSRLLVDERLLLSDPGSNDPSSSTSPPKSISLSPTPTATSSSSVKTKSSFKRFSDVLQPGSAGGKKDLWLVVFNDVVLRCQRTGVTTLPLASPAGGSINGRTSSLPELNAKGRYSTIASKRASHTKPRNLYKFIKIETWAIGDVAKPQAGIVSMQDIERHRTETVTGATKAADAAAEEEEDVESDDSDRKSKMSFSYWGADKITVQTPFVPNTKGAVPRRGVPGRKGLTVPSSYVRESSANAKFGTRLRSPEPMSDGSVGRPASRRQIPSQQSSRRAGTAQSQSDDSHAISVKTSKPAWDNNMRMSTPGTPVPSTIAAKRPRDLSATSSQAPRLGKIASPAPSEDSGVGFYRQMIAQDPSLS